MKEDIRIETERLLLRPITLDDTEAIYAYSKNENVGPNAGWKPHESIEETRELMEVIFVGQEGVFGIVLKATGKLIGTIGLVEDRKRKYDKVKMLGYAIDEAHWGCGYTTEAAAALIHYGREVLQLRLISVYCYPFNERSKRVIAKLGFHYEGRLVLSEQLYNGVVYDHECYAMVLEDQYAG